MINSIRYKKVLIIGGGAMAINYHLPRVFYLLGAEYVAIFDIDLSRRTELSNRFKKNNKIKILENIPNDTTYNLIIISTPPKFHFKYFRSLIKNSNHFLIEKPMALNTDEAISIHNLSKSHKKKVFVNLIRRTLDNFSLLRKIYCTKAFGKLKKIIVNEGSIYKWPAVSLGSFSRELNGGGVLMDTGPHTIDLLFQIVDEMLLESAFIDAYGNNSIEANCTLFLTADNAIPVSVNISRNRYLSNSLIFEFEEAILTASLKNYSIFVKANNGINYYINSLSPNSKKSVTFSHMLDIYYSKFLVKGNNNGVGPTDSVKIQKIIDCAYKVAQPIQGGF